MPLTKTQIQTLINTNLADFSDILPIKHREVETEILNFISNTTVTNTGFITIGDVGIRPVGYSYSVGGNVLSAVVDTRTTNGEITKVTLQNSMPSLSYFVRTSIESIGTKTNMENDNDIHPIVFKVDTLTTFFVYVEDMSRAQNIRLHIEAVPR